MPPRLVKRNEFNELAETLSEITEGGGARPYGLDNAPVYCIQMYISPSLDLRYVTTYNGRGMNDEDAGGEADADEVDPRAVALDVSLKSKFRSILAAVVKYIERAHGLTLAGIVVEFVRDAMGNILLLGVLRVEWATHDSDMAELVLENSMPRPNQLSRITKPILHSQTSKELDAARDELYFQHEMADATAHKVADVLPEHQEHLPPHTQPLPLEPSIDDLSQAEVAASTFLTQEASVHRLSYRPESRGTPLTDPVSMFRTRSPSPDRIRPGSATSTSSQQIQACTRGRDPLHGLTMRHILGTLVGTLEGEREQMVSSFNSRVTTLDGTLFQCRQQVEEAVALLQKEITHDREEIMSVIKRYHDKERELEHLVGEHESKRCQLDGELAEEQQTVIALRNQAEQYEQMIKVEADATQKTKLTTVYAEGRTNKPIVIDEAPEEAEKSTINLKIDDSVSPVDTAASLL
eukprot:gene2403-3133_t